MAGGVTGAGSPVRSALIVSHRPVPETTAGRAAGISQDRKLGISSRRELRRALPGLEQAALAA